MAQPRSSFCRAGKQADFRTATLIDFLSHWDGVLLLLLLLLQARQTTAVTRWPELVGMSGEEAVRIIKVKKR
jgi:hypothetical protein